MDVVDLATRSRMMSGIRGKDTKPELIVRSFLHTAGFRYRLHAKLPGKPDLVLRKHRTVIFVHGCFWHRHVGCRYTATPATNVMFWQEKLAANVLRDDKVQRQLKDLGWCVEVSWSCQLSDLDLENLAGRILKNAARADTNGKR